MPSPIISWNGFRIYLWNPPVAMPGIYRIFEADTGRSYIGRSKDIARRSAAHPHRKKTRLRAAIDEIGRDAFIVEPLFISIGQDHDLKHEEMQLIRDYDAVKSGFNVQEPNEDGSYGPVFSKIISEAQRTPEALERKSLSMLRRWSEERDKMISHTSTPTAKAKHQKATKAACNRPEHKAKRAEIARELHRDENYRSAAVTRLTLSHNTEHWKASMKAILTERNKSDEMREMSSIRAKRFMSDPEWKKIWKQKNAEANANKERGEKIRKSRTGTVAITDGKQMRFVKSETEIPNGWRRGWGPRNKL